MSIQFTSINQLAGAVGVSVPHDALTFSFAVMVDSGSAAGTSLMCLRSSSGALHEVSLNAAGNAYTLSQNWGAGQTAMGGTRALSVWHHITVQGLSVGGVPTLRAYILPAGATVLQGPYDVTNTAASAITAFWVGAAYAGYSALAKFAHGKVWARVLSAAEVLAEAQQATPSSASLVCYAPFAGANIGAALTSQTGSGGFANWVPQDFGGAVGTSPVLSAANPSYSSWPILIGADTLPST